MRVYFLIWGTIFLVFFLIYPTQADNKCYQAKICVHDGKEKCGRDSDGNIRRFLDSCDIKEYNCLRGVEYTKVNYQECNALPSTDDQVSKERLKSFTAEDENQGLGLEDDDENQADPVLLKGPQQESQQDTNENDRNDISIDGILVKMQEGSSSSKENRRHKTTTITTATKTIKPLNPRKAAVINEYWCWRAKYCHVERNEVCSRDRRLGQKKKFYSECHLYNHNCDFQTVILYYLSPCLNLSNHPPITDTPEVREKFAQFHCFKLKTCTPGGDSVCGFDDTEMFLAEFEDMCTLHKVNCEKRGFFTYIDASICEGQKKFQESSKDSDINRNLTSI